MSLALAFDVYGTLVNPSDMGLCLEELLGDKARAFGKLWHDKKVEYSFRRGLMEQYEDFEVCTIHALRYCMNVFGVEIPATRQQLLIEEFSNLHPYPDVVPGLEAIHMAGNQLAAFSNGTEVWSHQGWSWNA